MAAARALSLLLALLSLLGAARATNPYDGQTCAEAMSTYFAIVTNRVLEGALPYTRSVQ